MYTNMHRKACHFQEVGTANEVQILAEAVLEPCR